MVTTRRKSKKIIPLRIPTSLIGAAGEHFVMFELYRRGIMVGQPPQGVADVDLLVLDDAAKVVTSLQVKTSSKGPKTGWIMKSKHETLVSPRLWYIFVSLDFEKPVCFVIPSKVVAKATEISHSTWLKMTTSKGDVHNDSDMRKITNKYPFVLPGFPDGWMDKYEGRWDLLKES
jgi:hypothetical protein